MFKKLCFAIIVPLLLFCACAKGESDFKIEESPSDKSLIDLASEIYENSQLSDIAKLDGSITELNAEYPIECLRKSGGLYRVSYLGDGKAAVLLFDASGNRISGNVYDVQLLKSDFDRLKKGQSLEEVRKTDPNGEFLFLVTGRSDTPRVSSHCTKDGYLITIEYDASNTIVGISTELI